MQNAECRILNFNIPKSEIGKGNPMNRLDVVGKRKPMLDAMEKATGRARFTDDLALPGMLYGKILRSPLAHAKVLNVDLSEA